jgi:hypothetical protein
MQFTVLPLWFGLAAQLAEGGSLHVAVPVFFTETYPAQVHGELACLASAHTTRLTPGREWAGLLQQSLGAMRPGMLRLRLAGTGFRAGIGAFGRPCSNGCCEPIFSNTGARHDPNG